MKLRPHHQKVLNNFLKGMLIAVILAACNVAIESTAFGERLSWFTYEEIHGWLPRSESSAVIVDITEIPLTTRDDGTQVTSREALLGVIQGLASSGSLAIGLDVDFSPSIDGALHPVDQEFLEQLLVLRRGGPNSPGVPVFVGVHRGRTQPSSLWLGDKKYEELAAHLLAKRSRVPSVPSWVIASGSDTPLWGLGSALASSVLGGMPEEPGGWHWLRRANVSHHSQEPGLQPSEMLVDTSGIDLLVRNRLRIHVANEIEKHTDYAAQIEEIKVRGKMAFIGAADLNEQKDNSFFIPGKPHPYPGVYLHACAAQTIQSGFLYGVTHFGMMLADLLLATFVFGGVAFVRLALMKKNRKQPGDLALFLSLLIVSLGLAVLGGVLAVISFRIMWNGLVFVALAAVLHLFIEVIHDIRHKEFSSHAGK
jgi:CHASE2 domain-containing sensor protein